jgi:hypothetical protein
LCSHLRLGLSDGLFSSGFCVHLSSFMRSAWPAHFILDLINRIVIGGEGSVSSEAPHYAVFSGLLPLPPYRVQCSSQSPVLRHPQSFSSTWCDGPGTTGETVVIHTLICKILYRTREDGRVWTKW